MRRLAVWLLDSGPVLVLAVIAGAGSFTHIRATAIEHGQTGWMSWAVAVCVDLTCVMAARERQRDKRTGRLPNGKVSWPTLVLADGIILSLAANLHQAEPTVWGWITAATPAGAFLIAVSMLERRAATLRPGTFQSDSCPMGAPRDTGTPAGGVPSAALLAFARRVAEEHHARHGQPITPEALRARLGVSDQLAAELLRTLRAMSEPVQ